MRIAELIMQTRFQWILGVLIAAGLAMAGCGRKGPLEPPLGSVSTPHSTTSGPADNSVPRVEDKPFILDALI